MTYEEQARAWIQNAPIAEITIGRFTLKFQFGVDRDFTYAWDFMNWLLPDEYRGSPERDYFHKIIDALDSAHHDMEFIDELIEAMQKKQFNQGESNEN